MQGRWSGFRVLVYLFEIVIKTSFGDRDCSACAGDTIGVFHTIILQSSSYKDHSPSQCVLFTIQIQKILYCTSTKQATKLFQMI